MYKSAIFNYMPRKRSNTKFDKWYAYYKYDLIHIFKMMRLVFKEKYCPDKKWNNELFTKFCYLAYHTSSRYIPKEEY